MLYHHEALSDQLVVLLVELNSYLTLRPMRQIQQFLASELQAIPKAIPMVISVATPMEYSWPQSYQLLLLGIPSRGVTHYSYGYSKGLSNTFV